MYSCSSSSTTTTTTTTTKIFCNAIQVTSEILHADMIYVQFVFVNFCAANDSLRSYTCVCATGTWWQSSVSYGLEFLMELHSGVWKFLYGKEGKAHANAIHLCGK